MDQIIEMPEDYPYTECEICGEEIHNSKLYEVGNQYVCISCAQFLEAQEEYDDDDYDDDYNDYNDYNDED
jgi:RNA polymerase-binding transcription factor DksA